MNTADTARQRLVLIGDSIRGSYREKLADLLADAFEISTPDENCRATTDTLAHIEPWIIEPLNSASNGAVLHINCGLHDVKFVDPNKQPINTPNVPLEQYKQNVQQILRTVIKRTALPPQRIIWALTTPVIDDWHAARKSMVRREADVENYNRVASAVCREMGVRINDLHAVVMRHGPEQLLREDGVHYHDGGTTVLAEAVAQAVRDTAAN